MEFAINLIWFAIVEDTWLYWLHRFCHWEKAPKIIKDAHAVHHARLKPGFELSFIEWALAVPIPFVYCIYLFGPYFATLFLFWALFEANRGHGRFTKVYVPKWWYKLTCYAGLSYHRYHHRRNVNENYGQFLYVWDFIAGTMALKWRRGLWLHKALIKLQIAKPI